MRCACMSAKISGKGEKQVESIRNTYLREEMRKTNLAVVFFGWIGFVVVCRR